MVWLQHVLVTLSAIILAGAVQGYAQEALKADR